MEIGKVKLGEGQRETRKRYLYRRSYYGVSEIPGTSKSVRNSQAKNLNGSGEGSLIALPL